MGKGGRGLAHVERRNKRGVRAASRERARQEQFFALALAAVRAVVEDGADAGAYAVELRRAWEPGKDAAFAEADALVHRLAVVASYAGGQAGVIVLSDAAWWDALSWRVRVALHMMLQAYTGRLSVGTIVALTASAATEVAPPWRAVVPDELRLSPGVVRMPDVPYARWVASVVGAARARFLAGLVSEPGAWVSMPRVRVAAHPWALFVSSDEWRALREAAPRDAEACITRGKVPTTPHPVRWFAPEAGRDTNMREELGGMPSGVVEAAAQVVELLRGDRKTLGVDVPPELIAAMRSSAWLFQTTAHGARRGAARELLRMGADVNTVAELARVDASNVRRLAAERDALAGPSVALAGRCVGGRKAGTAVPYAREGKRG